MKYDYLVHYTSWKERGTEFNYRIYLESDYDPPTRSCISRWEAEICKKTSGRIDVMGFFKLSKETEKDSKNFSWITQVT